MTQIDIEKRLLSASDRLENLADLLSVLRCRIDMDAEDKSLPYGFRFAAEQATQISAALWGIVAAYEGEE